VACTAESVSSLQRYAGKGTWNRIRDELSNSEGMAEEFMDSGRCKRNDEDVPAVDDDELNEDLRNVACPPYSLDTHKWHPGADCAHTFACDFTQHFVVHAWKFGTYDPHTTNQV
jgi:hypothetical protein